MNDLNDRLRQLPAVDLVVRGLGADVPPTAATDAARRAVESSRHRVISGEPPPSLEEVVREAGELLEKRNAALLKSVVNATGVLIHTNLGRVPLGEDQLAAVTEVARGYSNLEYDLEGGRRGSRYAHAAELLSELTGAEAALIVNNNAAAVLLVLAALCRDREVIISRGELIEIGGEFRIPDVMEASGVRLIEVGTTNRTHLSDYERAIGPHTAAVLKVHPSNYKVVGFTSSVEARDLARMCRGRGILFLHDLGSGFVDFPGGPEWTRVEPPVDKALSDGADIVTFSGDKLLGGPQAGVILGRKQLIEILTKHPLLRALRVDKMTLAALEATLHAYLAGRGAHLPVWEMALRSPDDLEAAARAIAQRLSTFEEALELKAEAVRSSAVAGGGSLPAASVPSWGVALSHGELSADELDRRMRAGDPPVVGRIEDDRLLLDLRTVLPHQTDSLPELIREALKTHGGT